MKPAIGSRILSIGFIWKKVNAKLPKRNLTGLKTQIRKDFFKKISGNQVF
ncbi:MAG: hypothetical protein M0016_00510 [Deltaproteobacteria bacterium]|jgi:hypothetical protein|nr:hypothetical protein [Deltaproteobacteria bacterium]MDA8303641.1 hypothetical protein [Deltaproteobacteria bacterium]